MADGDLGSQSGRSLGSVCTRIPGYTVPSCQRSPGQCPGCPSSGDSVPTGLCADLLGADP